MIYFLYYLPFLFIEINMPGRLINKNVFIEGSNVKENKNKDGMQHKKEHLYDDDAYRRGYQKSTGRFWGWVREETREALEALDKEEPNTARFQR